MATETLIQKEAAVSGGIEQRLARTKAAAVALRNTSDDVIVKALLDLADALQKSTAMVLEANAKDVEKQNPDDPKTDRLRLTEARIAGIANSIRQVSSLPNPSGKLLTARTLENGLDLKKFSVPLGVVGAIYESRPNVTYDIAALCLRSMNGCVLKGSGDAEHSNKAALQLIKKALEINGIDGECVLLLPSARETVNELFTATRYVDVIIPRGSDGLIQFVRKNSRIPVIETGAGVCHIYVDKSADIAKAVEIVVNAKVSRPSVCNAVDTVLVHESAAPLFLQTLKPAFEKYGVEVFADRQAFDLMSGYNLLSQAAAEDYDREFLSLKCAVRVVSNLEEALTHIALHSTKHSEAIVSEDEKACERFLIEVDAAAVYANASIRFTDGEVFGLGAEIGISTQKLHARGPFALEKLVTEKWIVHGNGQIR